MGIPPSPFRSNDEQLEELIRRAEEKQQVLLEEHAALLKQVGSRRSRRFTTIALIAVVASTTSAAFAAGNILTERDVVNEAEASDQLNERAFRQYVKEGEACTKQSADLVTTIDACNQNIVRVKNATEAATAAAHDATPCTCRRTDAYCTCYHDPPFNHEAGEATLTNLQARLERCIVPRRSVTFLANVVFAVDGSVEIASLELHEPNRISADETKCLEQTIRSDAHVPPFAGHPRVMLQRLYDVSSP